MPRVKKYNSEEQKREGNRISAKAYHERNKACINAKRREKHAQKRAKVLECLAHNELKPWRASVKAKPIMTSKTNPDDELMKHAIQRANNEFRHLKFMTDSLGPSYIMTICRHVCEDLMGGGKQADAKRVIDYHLDRLEKTNECLKEAQGTIDQVNLPGGNTASQNIEQMLVEVREVLLWLDEVAEYAAEGGPVLVRKVREKGLMFQEEL
ncbi:hypothetical protein FA15DRAFT_658901 [Coprinopsis marcescibilis]|uniref:Uncharacterized protein n=1 Tax=Coprinopsis marcescibilis TaxID=230819 RepID=A0A5C3KL52_COPMA|nr:hypothetical protein FA15DRAFT_658901 [Coprinopsis marcescibilis]